MDLAPITNGSHKPDPSFGEPDSDRGIGSVAELNERLRELGADVVATRAMVSAESESRRKTEAIASESRSHLANGLITLGQEVFALRASVDGTNKRLDDAERREADRNEKIMLELSKLSRQDSIHDAEITQQRKAVEKQQTALVQLRSMLTLKNGAYALAALVITNLHHIVEALRALAGH